MSLIASESLHASKMASKVLTTQSPALYTLYRDRTEGEMVARKHSTACTDLAKKSYRCLEEFTGDKNMCRDFFEAFTQCRQATLPSRPELVPQLQRAQTM